MFRDGLADFCGVDTLDAYRKLFNAENYLRFIVKWELVGQFGEIWRTALGAIGTKAEEQMTRDAAHGLLDVERHNVMSYTMLSQLQSIITGANWTHFDANWPKKEYLETQLEVLNRLRGKAMHCRPWSPDDLAALDATLLILSRFTHSYRAQERTAQIHASPAMRLVPQPLRGRLSRMASTAGATSTPRKWVLQHFGQVGKYNKVGLALAGGAFEDGAPATLFTRTGLDCFFAASDPVTGRLDLYLPRVLPQAALTSIINEVERIEPLNGELPPTSRVEAGDRLDGLFRLPVALPLSLSMPD